MFSVDGYARYYKMLNMTLEYHSKVFWPVPCVSSWSRIWQLSLLRHFEECLLFSAFHVQTKFEKFGNIVFLAYYLPVAVTDLLTALK